MSIYIESTNETWELPDELAFKLTEYKRENPIAEDNGNADAVHLAWLATLSEEEKENVQRSTPEE